MNIVLSKVLVVDPTSKHHQQVVDIEIKNGEIVQIGKSIRPTKTKKQSLKGCCVSPGWLDLGTHIGEPGFEHRETLDSVCRAARKGGFTALAPMPNTLPVIDSKSQVAYLINHAAHHVQIYPIGALSFKSQGKDLAEFNDMHQAGAVAFSDGEHAVQDSGLMLRALDYSKSFNGLIIDQSTDHSLAQGGQVHESPLSTELGMPGVPSLAETLQIQKHIRLCEHSGGRMLFHLVTAKDSLLAIQSAKKAEVNIGASVSVFHLCWDEGEIKDFDPNKKIYPPLRSKSDRKALVKAFQKGSINILCSHHVPLDPEEKVMAFSDATPGSISLQTAFSFLRTCLGDEISLERIIDALAIQPRQWLNVDIPSLIKGNKAELTIFDPEANWEFTPSDNASRSSNTTFLGKTLTGAIVGTIIGTDVALS